MLDQVAGPLSSGSVPLCCIAAELLAACAVHTGLPCHLQPAAAPSPPEMLQGKTATRRILLFTRNQEPLKVGGLAGGAGMHGCC